MSNKMISKVAIFEDPRCQNHIPITLPERPERTVEIGNALKESSFSESLLFFAASEATTEELQSIHRQEHIAHVANQVEKARKNKGVEFVNCNSDVIVSEGSDTAARCAAGAVRDAVLKVLSPTENIKRAFCNVRPPGHHSHCHKSAGFCLYNNIWFGAEIARKHLKDALLIVDREPRIAIIDWDLHHGDGTQDFVLRNTELYTYFVSIHQNYKTNYPGTGKESKKNQKNSVIINHNIRSGGGDIEVKEYFNDILIKDLTEWRPDLIMISCGFDAHTLDSIGSLEYSSDLYGWMTKELVKVSEETCGGKIVSVLEGGYNLKALREASVFHVQSML